MASVENPFEFESNIQGAAVRVAVEPLHPRCRSDIEVDYYIKQLKKNLDMVGGRMKAAIRDQNGKLDF